MKLSNFKKHFFILIGLMYLFASCNQNPYLATHLAPSTDNLIGAQTDSFQIFSRTVYHDSIPSYGLSTPVLGALSNNLTYGNCVSTLYAQFNLPANSFSFDTSAVLDSVFICFPYVGTYGDTLSKMNLTVTLVDASSANKINNDANDKTYYSTDNFTLKSTPLVTLNNVPMKLKDSVKVYATKEMPQLRIPIKDAAFIQMLKNQSSTGAYANNTNFHDFLNGVYLNITSPQTTNALMQLATNNASISGLKVYYHTSSADSLTLLFGINANGTVSHFSHNFTGSKVLQAINNSTGNDSVIYVTGNAGVRGKLYIPGLSNLKNIVINRATLTLKDVDLKDTASLFSPPTNLLLTRYDASTKTGYSLEDLTEGSPVYGLSSELYYGGIRNHDGSYTFNIARYLQKLISGTYTNDGFFVEMYNAAQRPYQIVLGGGNNYSKKIKLKISYTKIH